MSNISAVKGAANVYQSVKDFGAAASESSSFKEVMGWMQQAADSLHGNETQTMNFVVGKEGDMAEAAINTALTSTMVETATALTQKLTSVYNDIMKMNL